MNNKNHFAGRIGTLIEAALLSFLPWMLPSVVRAANPAIDHDPRLKTVTLREPGGGLVLRLNYANCCVMDEVIVGGRQVIRHDAGVCSGIKVGPEWFTTRHGIPSPQVSVTTNTATIVGIQFGGGGIKIAESWRFEVGPDQIVWRIDREYLTGGPVEDTSMPRWEFEDMATWTGGLLGHGGVAWGKLFDAPNASYGVHNGKVTFWNKDQSRCLRTRPELASGGNIALQFTREPSGAFAANYSVTEHERVPKHDLSRFRRKEQDIWQSFRVQPGRVRIELTLSAPSEDEVDDRGLLKGVDGRAIREICHTIARIGAVDERFLGSNGYYSDCAVLHEPWLAQLGLAIQDPDYDRAFGETLDFQREHAIGSDGRVKSRWAGHRGDEMPGSYDPFGYYECQWGWLMDSQTSWAINVAEQFDVNGDRAWLGRQKAAAERVLDYLLRRDTDGNGLVEMMTESEAAKKGSDWIDVVWASYENALVSAQLYWALSLWTDLEELLSDPVRAERFRAAASQLKSRFNQTTAKGGFWDEQQRCYAYWRNKDGSIHGTNLVVPVNFSAIGYGLCDDLARRAAILDQMEARMRQEHLFLWPLCFDSYAKEEGHAQVNWPFPKYENGDLFLAWGELGTRAYCMDKPALAMKYLQNLLSQYKKDGLAFQRYLRQSQTGAGNDILANNCSIVVGLYRNLYGLQPKYNRLYLEPHLVPELAGTHLKFRLREQQYQVDLNLDDYVVSVDRFTVETDQPFGIATDGRTGEFFAGACSASGLSVTTAEPIKLTIRTWPAAPIGERRWTESGPKQGTTVRHVVAGLSADRAYRLLCDGTPREVLHSDRSGRLNFEEIFHDSESKRFLLQPE